MTCKNFAAPVELTDGELDLVTGGALLNVSRNDVEILNNSLNNNKVFADVDVNVLGRQTDVNLVRQ